MSAGTEEACADIAAQAQPGEHIEVFARRTTTALCRLAADGASREQAADGWLVGIRAVLDGQYGLASVNALSLPGLRAALDRARRIRQLAPVPWHGHQPASLALTGHDGQPQGLPGMSALARVTRQVSAAAGRQPVTATVGATKRIVTCCTTSTGPATYTQHEVQAHVRSAEPGLDAAQGARISATVTALPLGAVAEEYHRSLRHLAAPVAPGTECLRWLALSPLVAARMLSRLSRAFLRTAQPTANTTPDPGLITLVDDGRAEAGPAGAPFDDEGTPRRCNMLLAPGCPPGMLGSHSYGPTTGNASWIQWDSEVAVATTNCFFEPTCSDSPTSLLTRAGNGFVAEDLRGFRSGLDLTSSRIEFELSGAIVRDGEVIGSARLAVSTEPGQFFTKLLRILPGTVFYRIGGIFGGSWCLADGLLVAALRRDL